MRREAIAFGALLAVGCAGAARPGDPTPTWSALARALRQGDSTAIAQITGRSEAEVAASATGNEAELRAVGESLDRGTVERSARVALADGGVVWLVRDGEAWRIDRGVLGRPALARPIDAVIAFHDALVRSRLEGVLGVLARAPRAELGGELTRWLDGTADPEAVQISVQGETAVAVTPTGERLELVRESGEWRVVSF